MATEKARRRYMPLEYFLTGTSMNCSMPANSMMSLIRASTSLAEMP